MAVMFREQQEKQWGWRKINKGESYGSDGEQVKSLVGHGKDWVLFSV